MGSPNISGDYDIIFQKAVVVINAMVRIWLWTFNIMNRIFFHFPSSSHSNMIACESTMLVGSGLILNETVQPYLVQCVMQLGFVCLYLLQCI